MWECKVEHACVHTDVPLCVPVAGKVERRGDRKGIILEKELHLLLGFKYEFMKKYKNFSRARQFMITCRRQVAESL